MKFSYCGAPPAGMGQARGEDRCSTPRRRVPAMDCFKGRGPGDDRGVAG